MRVFIPKGNSQLFISKEIITENTYLAFYGFSTLGCEIIFYEGHPPKDLSKEDIVVGWITQVKMAIQNLGLEAPKELDYPQELHSYLGRKIWQDSLHRVYTDDSMWPVFVKPVLGKQFDGKLIKSLKDLVGMGSQEDRQIWCSEPIELVAEYRCFIKYAKLLDVRRYKGDFKILPNFYIIEKCIQDYISQPAAYSLDFGITKEGQTVLIEVNDAYALGNYGLFHLDYAKMISARWSQIVGIPDPFLF